jgi:Zn ribbon nucleic-acid-binding protein
MAECKACHKARSTEFKRVWKESAIEYKGGKCVVCGYDRCQQAMHFHHLEPNKKDNGFGSRRGELTEKDKEELDKTVLTCNRCHAEIHSGIVDVPIV